MKYRSSWFLDSDDLLPDIPPEEEELHEPELQQHKSPEPDTSEIKSHSSSPTETSEPQQIRYNQI